MTPQKTHAEKNSNDAMLNWLRAAVLGANDGIVSIASIVVGVAGATSDNATIMLAGLAGTLAGALSMAAGEYVSVSTQRDAEEILLKKERYEMKYAPDEEKAELAAIYEHKGLSPETAALVAHELHTKDALRAHIEAELHINPDELTNPWHAALASAVSFFAGAVLPLLVVYFAPSAYKIPATFVSVIIALSVTGVLSAHVGGADKKRATIRLVVGGLVAMFITYAVGALFGVSGI